MNSRRRGKPPIDPGLARLLELNGTIQSLSSSGDGTKTVVRRVKPSLERPFGLKYSLTLHAPTGERLMGFDNAHSIKASRRSKTPLAWDHCHRRAFEVPVLYQYQNADRLLSDFQVEVKRVLEEVNDE